VSVQPAARRDPLRTFRFRVLLDDGRRPVAGVQKVSGLGVAVTPRETWEGGNALHRYANPDRATWEPVTLHQGVALGTELEEWALAAVTFLRTGAPPTSGGPVKRNVVLEVLDHWTPGVGPPAARYLIRNAWVSRYEAAPALDALGNEIALRAVELTHEGWVLDPPTPAPATPRDVGDFPLPAGDTRLA
jgi:phage tail-like protein